jgi:hypothetical protein
MKPIVRALLRVNDELNEEGATVGGPSEAAVRVARHWFYGPGYEEGVSGMLERVHDPANFEDPMDVSVRLGDVVDLLREPSRQGRSSGSYALTADLVLRTFGGDRA